jgi:glycosyltransferase involved in cell wall biosynthesis
MKIVFYNGSSGVYGYAAGHPKAVGGAERQQWLLARALANKGWSVTVVVQGLADLEHGRNIAGIQFISLPEAFGALAPAQRLFSLYHFMSTHLPDWWYWRCASHRWGPAVAIAKRLRIRTIFAAGFDTDVHPRDALFERSRWWPLYAWGLAKTDRIFVQHEGQYSELSSNLRSKAAIIPSIVQLPKTTTPHEERQKYVAWVGMLRHPKRPDLLLEIASKADALQFIVCGGPSDHRSPTGYSDTIVNALKRLPNVDYRGQVPPEHAHDVIANASVLLSTSEGEGFPNVFLESWASGTPVVSITIDPDHAIEQLGLGSVSGNVEQAIHDMTELIRSPQRREAISVQARRYILDKHGEQFVTTCFDRTVHPEF